MKLYIFLICIMISSLFNYPTSNSALANLDQKQIFVNQDMVVNESLINVKLPSTTLTQIKDIIPVIETNNHQETQNKIQVAYKKLSVEEIKKIICEVFSNCKEALIIAFHESNFNQEAISRTNDYGVFQLNCRWQGRRVGGMCERFLDPILNIQIAHQIYMEQGWIPWTTKIYL